MVEAEIRGTCMTVKKGNENELATLGGGCFWCLEAVFASLQGVVSAISGYSGGKTEDPSYEEVCGGDTGHAEAVQVRFDPAILSFENLLEIFFAIHDPTTPNRQGADSGTQYRSVIFCHSPVQEAAARAMIAKIDGSREWKNPVVTEVAPFDVFYPAEDYHQAYFINNPFQPYCMAVVGPKVNKFRKTFPERLKSP